MFSFLFFMHLVMSKIRHVNDHVGSLFIWYCIDVIILKVTSECMCKGNWGRTSGGVSEVYTLRDVESGLGGHLRTLKKYFSS